MIEPVPDLTSVVPDLITHFKLDSAIAGVASIFVGFSALSTVTVGFGNRILNVSVFTDSLPVLLISLKLTWYVPAGNASTSDCVTVFPSPVWSTFAPSLIVHSNLESTSFLSPVILFGLVVRSIKRLTSGPSSTSPVTSKFLNSECFFGDPSNIAVNLTWYLPFSKESIVFLGTSLPRSPATNSPEFLVISHEIHASSTGLSPHILVGLISLSIFALTDIRTTLKESSSLYFPPSSSYSNATWYFPAGRLFSVEFETNSVLLVSTTEPSSRVKI